MIFVAVVVLAAIIYYFVFYKKSEDGSNAVGPSGPSPSGRITTQAVLDRYYTKKETFQNMEDFTKEALEIWNLMLTFLPPTLLEKCDTFKDKGEYIMCYIRDEYLSERMSGDEFVAFFLLWQALMVIGGGNGGSGNFMDYDTKTKLITLSQDAPPFAKGEIISIDDFNTRLRNHVNGQEFPPCVACGTMG
jgi:hypothetical protein